MEVQDELIKINSFPEEPKSNDKKKKGKQIIYLLFGILGALISMVFVGFFSWWITEGISMQISKKTTTTTTKYIYTPTTQKITTTTSPVNDIPASTIPETTSVTTGPVIDATTTTTTAPVSFRIVNADASVESQQVCFDEENTIIFSGRITSNGPGKAYYHWIRSDGTVGASQSVFFNTAETKEVSYSWLVPKPQPTILPWYLRSLVRTAYADESDWAQIVVTSPNNIKSNQAIFYFVSCGPE